MTVSGFAIALAVVAVGLIIGAIIIELWIASHKLWDKLCNLALIINERLSAWRYRRLVERIEQGNTKNTGRR